MPKNSSARGYTNVILLLNMKRFVRAEDQEIFETVRGSRPLADALRIDWPAAAAHQDNFLTTEEARIPQTGEGTAVPDQMLTEQVGFATGVFNTRMLEEYHFPNYVLNKDKVVFPPALRTNFQFRNLFERVWNRWEIHIRPSYTGFFVIRLTQRYQEHARPLIDLAQDVLHLQESLDVVSAQRWLKYNRQRYIDQPETLAEKERSVMALMAWMGVKEEETSPLLYYPVQWKLAMVAAGRFVHKIGSVIDLPGHLPIHLEEPEPSLSIPLHDSFIIHHFDTLLARPHMIARTKQKSADDSGVQIEARVTDLHNSPRLRRALVNLLDGTILQIPQNPDDENGMRSARAEDNHFPEPRWSITDSLLEQNVASWNDEFCVLNARTAIIIPSRHSQNYEMAVSTVPSATLRIRYPRYWSAVERMVEFVMEIHMFAELLEGISFDLLTEIVDAVHRLRQQIVRGDIQLDDSVAGLITKAADLRKQTALVQSLSHPQMWSRSEAALRKARALLKNMGVPERLSHIERNIASINSVVDQVDEWYLADLSEKSNDRAHYLTILVTAASLLLTLLILPSFWADIWQVLPENGVPARWLLNLGIIGTGFAALMMVLAGYLLLSTLRRWQELKALLKRLLAGEG